jgi:hypothetical protein
MPVHTTAMLIADHQSMAYMKQIHWAKAYTTPRLSKKSHYCLKGISRKLNTGTSVTIAVAFAHGTSWPNNVKHLKMAINTFARCQIVALIIPRLSDILLDKGANKARVQIGHWLRAKQLDIPIFQPSIPFPKINKQLRPPSLAELMGPKYHPDFISCLPIDIATH